MNCLKVTKTFFQVLFDMSTFFKTECTSVHIQGSPSLLKDLRRSVTYVTDYMKEHLAISNTLSSPSQ